MAACENQEHINNPISENPTSPITPLDRTPSSSSSPLTLPNSSTKERKRSESFSSMNIDSLHMCTEGLGFESLDNIEDLKMEFYTKNNNDTSSYEGGLYRYNMKEKLYAKGYPSYRYRKGKNDRRAFPPPISCMDKTGKPCISFQSYKEDGRFILKETRTEPQDILHACREDGRLRLNFVHHLGHDDEDDDSGDCDNDSDGDDGRE